jgi:carbon storage regulator
VEVTDFRNQPASPTPGKSHPEVFFRILNRRRKFNRPLGLERLPALNHTPTLTILWKKLRGLARFLRKINSTSDALSKEATVMLVLTRKETQRIRIGDEITLTVVRIDGNKVRIGIEAPRGVAIQRSELLELPAEVEWSEAACG